MCPRAAESFGRSSGIQYDVEVARDRRPGGRI
jgi:hypothetical protein